MNKTKSIALDLSQKINNYFLAKEEARKNHKLQAENPFLPAEILFLILINMNKIEETNTPETTELFNALQTLTYDLMWTDEFKSFYEKLPQHCQLYIYSLSRIFAEQHRVHRFYSIQGTAGRFRDNLLMFIKPHLAAIERDNIYYNVVLDDSMLAAFTKTERLRDHKNELFDHVTAYKLNSSAVVLTTDCIITNSDFSQAEFMVLLPMCGDYPYMIFDNVNLYRAHIKQSTDVHLTFTNCFLKDAVFAYESNESKILFNNCYYFREASGIPPILTSRAPLSAALIKQGLDFYARALPNCSLTFKIALIADMKKDVVREARLANDHAILKIAYKHTFFTGTENPLAALTMRKVRKELKYTNELAVAKEQFDNARRLGVAKDIKRKEGKFLKIEKKLTAAKEALSNDESVSKSNRTRCHQM